MRGRRRAAAAIGLTALLAGCTVGPDYRTPDTGGRAAPAFAVAGPTIGAEPPPDAWWRLFENQALDTLVAESLAANTDVRTAVANLTVARAALDEARAGRLPQTPQTATVGYGVSLPSLILQDAARVEPQPGWTIQPTLDVSWELDLYGRIRRGVQAARADVEGSQAALDAVRVSVAAETARAFADACSYGASAAVQRRSIDIAARSAAVTRTRRDAGAAAAFEVARAESLEAQTRALLPTLEAQRRSALFRLAVLTGRTPEAAIPAAAACATAPTLAVPLPVGAPADLLARRPDVREAERRLAADTYRIGVATADLYPKVSLGATLSEAASNLVGLTAAAGRTWAVGPMISWLFPNQVAIRARIRAARGRSEADLAAFDGAVLGALRDVEQALAAEQADLARRDTLRVARDQDAIAVDVFATRFRAGAIGSLDEFDAERTLISDQAGLAAADQQLASDQVLVFKALGGGWIAGSEPAAAARVIGGAAAAGSGP